jgi:hypothetical protein
MKLKVTNGSKKNRSRLGWLIALPLALVVLTHAMIHLMYITWTGTDVEIGFNGESFLPSVATDALVMALMAVTIAAYTAATLGIIRFPFLRDRVSEMVIVGSAASLAGFAVMLPGLVPNAVAHVGGPITSIVLMLGARYSDELAVKASGILPRFLSMRMGVNA